MGNKWNKIWKKREKIYIPTLRYTLIRLYTGFIFKVFYKKVHVRGFDHVPHTEPVIFAPNHQNALMDALAIVYTCQPLQPVFLARQDVFNSLLAAHLLTVLKIMPVYRDRDGGMEAIKKNEKIFDIVNQTLINKKQIGIMPEARHGDKRRLKNTMKGTYRIAFRAQEEFGDRPAVKIIPVGLEYTDYVKYQAELSVNYGKPIEVSEYMPVYKENTAKGILALKKRYEEEVKKLMIHIETEDYYETYENLRTIYSRHMRIKSGVKSTKLPERVTTDKQLIALLDSWSADNPQAMQKLDEKVSRYFTLLKKYNLRNWVIEKSTFSFLPLLVQSILSILFLPLFLYGFINNFLPFKIPVLATKNIKDIQFHSSVKFVVALLAIPVFYLLQFLVVVLFSRGIGWIEVAYLISLPVTGWCAKVYYFKTKKVLAKWRFSILKWKKNKDVNTMLQLHGEIISTLDTITN